MLAFHIKIASCSVVSCRAVSYRVVSCRIVSHRIASHHITSHRIAWYRIASYRVVSCRVMSYRVVSCRVVSCHIVPCHKLYHITFDNIRKTSYTSILRPIGRAIYDPARSVTQANRLICDAADRSGVEARQRDDCHSDMEARLRDGGRKTPQRIRKCIRIRRSAADPLMPRQQQTTAAAHRRESVLANILLLKYTYIHNPFELFDSATSPSASCAICQRRQTLSVSAAPHYNEWSQTRHAYNG